MLFTIAHADFDAAHMQMKPASHSHLLPGNPLTAQELLISQGAADHWKPPQAVSFPAASALSALLKGTLTESCEGRASLSFYFTLHGFSVAPQSCRI